METALTATTGRITGSRSSGRLRETGMVPGVVYGLGRDAVSVSVEWTELRRVLSTEAGLNALIDLHVDGETELTLVKDMQRHPVKRNVVHVDFLRLDRNAPVSVDVPVIVFGFAKDIEDRRGICLSGHTDVVPVDGQEWDSDPFQALVRDEKIFGRGTADMKSFIAIALAFVPQFLERRLRTPVHFAFSYDEEVGHLGARRNSVHSTETDTASTVRTRRRAPMPVYYATDRRMGAGDATGGGGGAKISMREASSRTRGAGRGVAAEADVKTFPAVRRLGVHLPGLPPR